MGSRESEMIFYQTLPLLDPRHHRAQRSESSPSAIPVPTLLHTVDQNGISENTEAASPAFPIPAQRSTGQRHTPKRRLILGKRATTTTETAPHMTDALFTAHDPLLAAASPLVTPAGSDTTATEPLSPQTEKQQPQPRTTSKIGSSKAKISKRLAIVVPDDDAQTVAVCAAAAATTQSAVAGAADNVGRRGLSASLPELHKAYEHTMPIVERPWSEPDAPRDAAQSRADTDATLRGTSGYCSPVSSMRRRRRSSSTTAGRSYSNERPESSLILVEATQETVRESNWFRSQPRSSTTNHNKEANEIEVLRRELDETRKQQRIEYELRTIAETKCARMECELAELSSNIQLEAQNMVAMERRGHKREIDRLTRTLAEVQQLRDVDGEQVACLKQCLEAAASDLDGARAEVARLRSAVAAFEHQPQPSSEQHQSAPPPHMEPPHIAGRMFFGTDGTRADTRVAEFLGFLNVASEREAMGGAFVQRCMREDVEPTLGVNNDGSSGSGMPSLSAWQRHRRLLHSVMDNTLVLEAFTPRTGTATRVLSLACHLCGSSTTAASAAASSLSTDSIGSSMSSTRCELYRLRFGDNEDSKPLCAHCHARMVAVCSFFSYLRIVRKGLIKRPIADIWLEVNKARLQMWLARSGASPECNLTIADGL
ncbi:RAB3A interacting protein [Coemansia sp. RSA 1646]|nr:RAB3A interacting protein [Coemansia sp. RSA 1646]